MKIRALDELKQWSDNPRKVRPMGDDGLLDSVRKFGVEQGAPCNLQPVVVNTHPDSPGTVLSGSRRCAMAREAGFEGIWVIECSLDSSQMAELAVRLNISAGDWDWGLLAEYGGESLFQWGIEDLQLPDRGADEDVQLVFDAATGPGDETAPAPAPLSEPPVASDAETPDAIPGPVHSTNRQFYLFLTDDELTELRDCLRVVGQSLETENDTETILELLRRAAAEATA